MFRSACASILVVVLTAAFSAHAQTATRPTAPRPKPAAADPFAEGAQIEAKWGSVWYGATVLTRTPEGAAVRFSDGMKETNKQADLRVRGVTTDEVKPDFMVRYFGANAHVEYAQGPWWHDGLIVKRDGERALVRDEHGFTKWMNLVDLRSREVGPGGLGTVAPADEGEKSPAAATSGAASTKRLDTASAKELSLDAAPAAWSGAPDPATQPSNVAAAGAASARPMPVPPLLVGRGNHHQTTVFAKPGAAAA